MVSRLELSSNKGTLDNGADSVTDVLALIGLKVGKVNMAKAVIFLGHCEVGISEPRSELSRAPVTEPKPVMDRHPVVMAENVKHQSLELADLLMVVPLIVG